MYSARQKYSIDDTMKCKLFKRNHIHNCASVERRSCIIALKCIFCLKREDAVKTKRNLIRCTVYIQICFIE